MNRDEVQPGEHADLHDRIEARRADPEYMARVRRLVEDEAPTLALLSDD